MYDIIIIGGGPAGLTAAIYARRANKSVVVIEKDTFGGQITFSPKVENIPGFTEISGNEFAEKLVAQNNYEPFSGGGCWQWFNPARRNLQPQYGKLPLELRSDDAL